MRLQALSLSLTLLISAAVFAQNWSPFNSSEAFNYCLNSSTQIETTIRVDSFAVFGSDSVFFLHPQMCDSCVTITGGPIACDSCYGRKNISPFLQLRITRYSTGDYWLKGDQSYSFKPFAGSAQTWLFDSINGINCTIVSADTATIFSQVDSIKLGVLSNGDSIAWSKDHGVVMWPDGVGGFYRLAGIHGRNVGILVPRMKDYFNFQVGDMFQYYGSNWQGVFMQGYWYYKKYTITSVIQNGDSLKYHVYGYKLQCYPSTSCYSDTIDTDLIYVDSAMHFGNLFNHELILTFDGIAPSYVFSGNGDTSYNLSRLFIDSTGRNGIKYGLWQTQFTEDGLIPINSNSDTLVPVPGGPFNNGYYNHFAGALVEGLGAIYFETGDNFENGEYYMMTAYRKGSDSVGVFYSDSYLLGVDDPEQEQPTIFPVPASDVITVRSAESYQRTFEIYDMQGRLVKTIQSNSSVTSIPVNDLAAGCYCLRVSGNNTRLTRCILISR